jgi:Rrf2 family protein
MNKVNRKVEYALMAIQFMSNKFAGELSSVKEVCESTGAPFDATARVMQLLAQKGILKSEQGARGGYLLVQDLSKVNYYDFLETIVGPMAVAKCLGVDHGSCELGSRCTIKAPLIRLNQRLIEFYQGITMRDLLAPANKLQTPTNSRGLASSCLEEGLSYE